MNILNNRNKSTNIFKVVALCLIAAVSFTLVSCDDDMDIQQSYPFTVEVMPVPNKVTKGQTVEIRCELKKEGDFANTLYTIRYFQFEGEGKLKMDNGITFLPNDRYLLENEKFRLYYTAEGDEAHYGEAAKRLTIKAARAAERRKELKQHEKNVRTGKKKPHQEEPQPAPAAKAKSAEKSESKRPRGAVKHGRTRAEREKAHRAAEKQRAARRFAHSRPVKKGKGSIKKDSKQRSQHTEVQ